MPLEAKVDGKAIEYTPSPIQTLFERLSYNPERNFYTRRLENNTLVRISPSYYHRDIFKYKATISNDLRNIGVRLSEPLREYLTIHTQKEKEIIVERDMKKGSILVKQNIKKERFTSRRIFTFDDDVELERYVRGLL
ncbi:MAG: hypothetical protein Q8R18_03360 [bacterium]|nr:hypothetical protein [bacterium]